MKYLKKSKEEKSNKTTDCRISRKEMASYSLGDLGCCLVNYMILNYLSFYCSVIMKIPLVTVGIITAIVFCWDAVNDLIIGHLIDRTDSKEGKARPWIKHFMVPCCISAVLIYSCPKSFSVSAKTGWIGIAYFLFILFYTCINLPYESMLSLMSTGQKDRTGLCTSRYIGAYIGTLTVSLIALPLVNYLGGDSHKAEGYRWVMVIFGIIALICFFLLYKNCHEKETDSDKRKEWEKSDKSVKFANIKWLLKNKACVIVLCTNCIYWFRYPFYGTTMTYYFKFYLGLNESASSIMYTAGNIVGIAILTLIPRVTAKWDKKKPLIMSCIISAVSMMFGFVCGKNPVMATIMFAINYGMESFPCAILMSMLADSLDYGRSKVGRKINGVGYAVNSFCTKIGMGISGFIVPLILKIGQLNINNEVNDAQSFSAVFTVRIVFWIIPALLSVVMIFVIDKYPLDRDRYMCIMNHQKEENLYTNTK